MCAELQTQVFCILARDRDMLEDLRSSLHQSLYRLIVSGDAPAGVRLSDTLSAVARTDSAQLQLATNYHQSALRCEITPRPGMRAQGSLSEQFTRESAHLLLLVQHAVLGNTLIASMSTGTSQLQEPLAA